MYMLQKIINKLRNLFLDEYAGKMEKKYPGFKCCIEPSPWWYCD